MKKIVKKFTVALIVAMLAVMMVPFSVAASEDTYTVYADVPDSWGTPNIWAWTDGGGNVFDAWPGEPMEAGEDGLYVAEIPKTALNFLINYDGDSNKTRDIKVTGADCKIVVNADLSVSIEYLEAPEEPTDEEETTVKEEETTAKQDATEQTTTQASEPGNSGLGPEVVVIIIAIVVVVIIIAAIIFVVFKKQ